MTNISNNIAISAYKRALNANRTQSPQQALKIAENTMKVLKIGDNIEINNSNNNVSKTSFPEVAKQVIAEQAQAIKATDQIRSEALKPNSNGEILGTDNTELIRTYNEAEATLVLAQEVRRRLVEAFQDLVKTPL